MEIFPISIVFLILLVLSVRKGSAHVLYLTITLLPFGMAAFVNLTFAGNLALLIPQIGVTSTVALIVFHRYSAWVKFRSRVDLLPNLRTLQPEESALILFAVYATISSIFFARIFEGNLHVVPLRPSTDGIYIGDFRSRVIALGPSSSNLSQAFYILLSIAFFFLCKHVIAHKRRYFIHRALEIAASINVFLGILDFFSLDVILSVIRTASYALNNTHEVAGFARVIGGFPEASSFGQFSVAMGIYFLVNFIRCGTFKYATLAFSNLLFGLFSLSTTAFIGVGFALSILLLGFIFQLLKNQVQLRAVIFLLMICSCALFFFLYSSIVEIPNAAGEIYYKLFLSKSESASALERQAWASLALNAFTKTYMLGAGIGSLRGNGWISIYLGSVGLFGTSCILYFLCRTLFIERHGLGLSILKPSEVDKVIASRAAALTLISMGLASATTPDLGLLLMLFCAMCSLSKVKRVSHSRKYSFLQNSEYLKSYYRY